MLNLIHAPDWQVELLHRPLVGAMVFFAPADCEWLLYLLHGRAVTTSPVPNLELGPGDALHIAASDDAAERLIIDGGGELLAIRLQAPPAAAS